MSLAPALRYLAAGGLCALLHNGVMIGSAAAGIHYAAANLASFALVTPLAYWLHCRSTFRVAPAWDGLMRFGAGVALNLPLSTLLFWLLCDVLAIPMPIAAPVATVVMTLFNFAMARLTIHWGAARPAA